MARHDVLIIGTRCAGSPLAMLLARQGLEVLAVDRVQFPSDTVSTHFMWPRTTAFLGAQLLSDAIPKALRNGTTQLDAALAAYQSTFREKTMPIFEYTLRAASLKDPKPTLRLYQRIVQSSVETKRFMDVLSGNTPFKDFFNPGNVARLSP
jgi:2-polyprenyl-6-methoxyphenol hydroxylase-like FAD-dependent oxidoreductase